MRHYLKRFANKLFGKLTLGILIIGLQFFWLAYLIYDATSANSLVNFLFEILAVVLSLHIANKEIRTSYKLSWIFLILFLPVFGILAYYLFGRAELTKRTRRRMVDLAKRYAAERPEDPAVREALCEEDFYAGKQSLYISSCAGYPLYREDTTRYYSKVEELFPVLLEDLRGARHFIFLEYFIVEEGEMFDSILEILEQKAQNGVLVRFIYDDVGSIQTLPPKYYKVLEQKGIECVCFNPFRPVMSVIMNNRDHRKITVIDGRIAYTGGFNLADEYINAKTRFGYWKDAGIRVTGDCVWSFTTMFLEIWTSITRAAEDCAKYRVTQTKTGRNAAESRKAGAAQEKKGYIQPYGDSPMDYEDVGENVYLNLIAHAERYVYIFTPYLILTSEMIAALTNAAKSGVDVRIVVPGVPDKKLVYQLTKSHFPRLIEGGVKIYQFTPGFLHSKCFVVDDRYATVGTINLDYRSLCLHFECGVFMYRTAAVMQVKQDMLAAMENSLQVEAEGAREKPFIVRQFLGLLKLLAPML